MIELNRTKEDLFDELRAHINANPDLMFVQDHLGLYKNVYANNPDLLFVPKEQIIGKNCTDLLPEHISAQILKAIDNVKNGSPLEEFSYELEVPEGINYFNARVVKAGKDSFLSIVRDETERKQMELQLRQAQKMESIGILTGGIAHEFNNLLSPIIGYTEMLLESEAINVLDKESLGQINIAGHRAKDLVKQLLAFGRQSMSRKEAIDLLDLVNSTINLIQNTSLSNIHIRKSFDKELPLIIGMANEIHQVILNLCLNACIAMPGGGELHIRIADAKHCQFISAEGRKREGDFVCLSFHDSGIGMVEEVMEHIFDPFFTTRSIGQGSGLGLSVVQGIIEQHRGHIEVDSKPGVGSTFYVYLPIAIEKVAQSKVIKKVIQYGTESILLIDDEKIILDLTKKMLERLGYKVTAFLDTDIALNEFIHNKEHYDLVITDFGMSKENGTAFAGKIKSISPELSVILMTGYSDLVSWEDISLWDSNTLLAKPFELLELSSIVRFCLDKKMDK